VRDAGHTVYATVCSSSQSLSMLFAHDVFRNVSFVMWFPQENIHILASNHHNFRTSVFHAA